MFSFTKDKIITGVTFLFMIVVTGSVIAMQINSVTQNELKRQERIQTQLDDYKAQVDNLNREIGILKKECADLNTEYNEALEAANTSNIEYNNLFVEYENNIIYYKKYAGLMNVSGSGIDIGVDDAQKLHGQYGSYLVHDVYLVEIVNVLKGAGAQAIAINGQRISSMSECLCLGPSIRVNGERLFAPYHIEAIGEPQTLMQAFINSNIYNEMKKQELIVDPVIKEKIVINKYSKDITRAISSLENQG